MDARHQAFVGRICSYVAQFVLIVALPLILPPEEFTQYNLIMPVLVLGSSVIYGWLNGAAFRWAHTIASEEDGQLGGSVSYYYLALLLLSAVASVLLLLMGRLADSIIPFAIFAISIKDLFLKLSNANEDYSRFASANALYMIGKLIFLALLFVLKIKNIHVILVLFLASELTFLLPFAKYMRKSTRIPTEKIAKTLMEMFRYGGPLIGASIAIWIVSLSDRYLLNLFCNKITVANYILVYQFAANAITVPLMFFITIYFPTLLKMEREQGLAVALHYNNTMFKKYCLYAPLYALVVGVALYVLLKIFYQKYQADGSLIAIMMAAQIVCGASHFFNKKYELDNRTHLIAIAVFVSALVGLTSNLILIPRLDAMGAAISGFLAYGALIVVTANMDRFLDKSGINLARKVS